MCNHRSFSAVPQGYQTALMVAASAGNTSACQLLLQCGADVFLQDKVCLTSVPLRQLYGHNLTLLCLWLMFQSDMTALMAAAAGGFVEVVRTLLACGADVHTKDEVSCLLQCTC